MPLRHQREALSTFHTKLFTREALNDSDSARVK